MLVAINVEEAEKEDQNVEEMVPPRAVRKKWRWVLIRTLKERESEYDSHLEGDLCQLLQRKQPLLLFIDAVEVLVGFFRLLELYFH